MKILLADDDRTMSRIASLALTVKGGHEVICASDGAEAVSLAESSPPELILLDAMMPNMDGLEACRKLKANPRTRDIPVIFLSAKSEQEEIRKVLDAGAAGYVRKPFDPATLWDQIKDVLTGSGRGI